MALPSACDSLAANVRREMKLRGWTQSTLASETGLAQPQVSEILNSKRNHRIDTLERLAKAFAIPVSSLLLPPSGFADDRG